MINNYSTFAIWQYFILESHARLCQELPAHQVTCLEREGHGTP